MGTYPRLPGDVLPPGPSGPLTCQMIAINTIPITIAANPDAFDDSKAPPLLVHQSYAYRVRPEERFGAWRGHRIHRGF